MQSSLDGELTEQFTITEVTTSSIQNRIQKVKSGKAGATGTSAPSTPKGKKTDVGPATRSGEFSNKGTAGSRGGKKGGTNGQNHGEDQDEGNPGSYNSLTNKKSRKRKAEADDSGFCIPPLCAYWKISIADAFSKASTSVKENEHGFEDSETMKKVKTEDLE